MISRALAKKLRAYIEKAALSLTDEDALDAVELYPIWQINTAYTAGDRYRHEGVLYRCIQSHTSQADWTPDKTPALWTVVSLDEWTEWVQPTGAHDAYMKGDKVSHNGRHWVCDMDYNTYEPGVYGWTTME